MTSEITQAQAIDRLREDCAELYQVIAVLAELAGVFDTEAVQHALDNALAAADGEPRPHENLLPFVVQRP